MMISVDVMLASGDFKGNGVILIFEKFSCFVLDYFLNILRIYCDLQSKFVIFAH